MSLKKEPIGRVVMLHGIKGTEPDKNIGKMAPAFRQCGFSVALPHYDSFNLWDMLTSKFIDSKLASILSTFIQPTDILLGHSNGAALAYLISKKVHVQGCILINAALDTTKVPDARFTHVYYNGGDMVCSLSSLLPFSPWGAMGNQGYTGRPRHDLLNIDCGDPPYDLPPLSGHNAILEDGVTASWARYAADLARTEVERGDITLAWRNLQ